MGLNQALFRSVGSLLLVGAAIGLSACASTPSPVVVQPTASAPTAAAATAAPPAPTVAPTLPTAAPTVLPTAAPTALPPTPIPLLPQTIAFSSPPDGQLVGSPVVITGNLARAPLSGRLSYRFNDNTGQQLGAGEFAVSGDMGQPAGFNASLGFSLPAQGGDVRVELFDREVSGTVVAQAALTLFVAPPQAMTITSPPANQFIGSPMVVSGNLARLPFQSNLAYVFTDSQGRQLGTGIIPVQGQPGRPTSFSASLPLNLPLLGGDIQLSIYDQNVADNAIVASAVLPLKVVPQPQQIRFTSPPANVFVGSPVVITGRAVRYPQQGSLGYRITDSAGVQLGVGAFPVTGAPGQGAEFTASLDFNLPQQGGPVQITLSDQNVNTGVIIATATLSVQVVAAQQSIVIDTPPAFTQVGSPVVITGRTARYPNGGTLAYTVRDEAGNQLGRGIFPVNGPVNLPATFNQSLTFNYPAFGGAITIEVSDVDNATGVVFAATSLTLRVAAPPYPAPQPR
ncbi:MAG: hypothetical protein H7Z42_08560 [Roseiflexaceae bacterium]|nr:hypothetical protein [Roseiflexaceae bacterium]